MMGASSFCLTHRPGQAYRSRHGLGRPKPEAHKSRANPVRGFFVQNGKSYGRSMWESARIAGPQAGRPTRMVSPTLLAEGVRLSQLQPEDKPMSQDNTTGASAATTFRYVSLDTAVKRLRRHLSKTGATLVKSKPGTKAWRELGDFAIRSSSGEILLKSVNLTCLMQTAELLADHERIELPNRPGWRFFVARQVAVQDGASTHYRNDPVSRVFFTQAQAMRAADAIEDRDGIVVVAFSATGRSGGRHAD